MQTIIISIDPYRDLPLDIFSDTRLQISRATNFFIFSVVAMGTSLPDTFASKTAAIQDKTADSSIGNVTGSNAVNVFLGIGLAWAIAAVHHSWNGTEFRVRA